MSGILLYLSIRLLDTFFFHSFLGNEKKIPCNGFVAFNILFQFMLLSISFSSVKHFIRIFMVGTNYLVVKLTILSKYIIYSRM